MNLFFVLSLPYCLDCVIQPSLQFVSMVFPDHTHLLFVVTCWEMVCLLGSPVYDIFLCFLHFPIRCAESGVVLDCIES